MEEKEYMHNVENELIVRDLLENFEIKRSDERIC